jgi:hypothetical protein
MMETELNLGNITLGGGAGTVISIVGVVESAVPNDYFGETAKRTTTVCNYSEKFVIRK